MLTLPVPNCSGISVRAADIRQHARGAQMVSHKIARCRAAGARGLSEQRLLSR